MTLNFKATLLAATVLGATTAAPAWAQTSDESSASSGNDIIVTARRVEERLQDVPISITVLDERSLANNNITNAKDIATYTPGLSTNNRFGSDNTTWTIRGFTQEQRTTATVGTYFADVVAPRGSGATQGGDGAGPGNLFDLANVQVLKGPQGTLQGRNSTGGAVMIVPRKPTDQLEGYVEGSVGDYSMYRMQGVINLPLADTFKVRLGVDRMKRDGYLKNVGQVGFGPYGDAGGSVDYWAGRLSIVADLTPDLENYTVATWSHSKSTGVIPKVTRAFLRDQYSGVSGIPTGGTTSVNGIATVWGQIAQNQINSEAACGFWCVSNPVWDSRSESETWQAINTTTWTASDSLTVKGILSYGEFRGYTTLDLFGIYHPVNGAVIGTVTNPLQVRSFSMTRAPDGFGLPTNAESSFVSELQFQGHGDKFNWQGGLYLEVNDPLGKSGTNGNTQSPCGPVTGTVPAGAFQVDRSQVCLLGQTGSSLGRVGLSTTENYFRGKAIYWQGMYELTDKLKVTGGIRYTWDKMRSDFAVVNLRYYSTTTPLGAQNPLGIPNRQASGFNGVNVLFPTVNPANGALGNGVGFCNSDVAFGSPGSAGNPLFPASEALSRCGESHTVKTSAPTWLLGLDFKPMDDVLLYAKYSRGYRQGGVASFGLDQLQDYGKEKVDTYEVGAKASWRGSMPGFFNLSAFYNDFTDQQLQIGIQCNPSSACPQTTAIINAGKSKLYGFEVEAGIEPFEGFKLQAAYAYLKTSLDEIIDVRAYILARNSALRNGVAGGTLVTDFRPIPIGSPIPNAIPHKLVLSGSYTLPLPESVGRITLGATMVYQSKYRAVSDPPVLVSPCPGATVNTNANVFNCSAATPFTFASEYGVLPSSNVVNLNVTWEEVAGMPIDAAFFMTNVTKEKYYLHANVQSQASSGYVSNIVGEPRMFGGRLKYRF